MTKNRTIQVYRGTTAQNDAYTGSVGEITMDVTTNTIRIHDGITLGGHTIGGGESGDYHPDLFDYKWADHLVSDVQWLRGDTFSWQDGGVYEAAYNHLVADHSVHTWGESGGYTTQKRYPAAGDRIFLGSSNTPIGVVASYDSATDTIITVNNVAYTFYSTIPLPANSLLVSTETIAGTTVTFYASPDGHKICTADQESNVAAIYTATGVAWYYILDTTNQRFKLPRSKHNKYAASTPVVGNGKGLGITNGINNYTWSNGYATSGYDRTIRGSTSIPTSAGVTVTSSPLTDNIAVGISADPANSGVIATLAEDTDQHKYLYFYVGEFTQTAIENTAGLNAELFNGKADVSSLATETAHVVTEFQEPTAANNYTWYRKYKDGWVEQGGIFFGRSYQTVNLPVEMASTYYTAFITDRRNATTRDGNENGQVLWPNCTTTTMYVFFNSNADAFWEVKGMYAQ